MKLRKMKLKNILALSIALSSIALVGCGSGSSDESSAEQNQEPVVLGEVSEPVEVVFWHAMTGDQEVALEKLTKDFMKENELITINLQNQSNYTDLLQKLTVTSASPKNLPTITQAYPNWLYAQMQEGLVTDLTDFIYDDEYGIEDYDDILPDLMNSGVVDGKIYGMPFNKSTEVLWYNKTIFEDLDLEVPETLEELEEVSKIITYETGVIGAGFDALHNYYTTYLFNEGVYYTPEFDVTGDISTNCVNYYLDGIKDGYFRIAGVDNYLSGPFGNENIAMYVGSTAGESFVLSGADDKFEVGVAPYPSEYAIQQGTDIYMFDNTTNDEKVAAFEYLKYLTDTDSQIYWGIETGYMPIRTSALESEEYVNCGSLMSKTFAEATENLYVSPIVAGSDVAGTEIKTTLEGILAVPDTADVEKSLDSFANILETIW